MYVEKLRIDDVFFEEKRERERESRRKREERRGVNLLEARQLSSVVVASSDISLPRPLVCRTHRELTPRLSEKAGCAFIITMPSSRWTSPKCVARCRSRCSCGCDGCCSGACARLSRRADTDSHQRLHSAYLLSFVRFPYYALILCVR